MKKSEFEFTFSLKNCHRKRWQFKYKTIMQDSLFVVPSQTFRYLFEDLFIGHHSSAAVADTDSLLDFLSVFPAMVGYLAVWNHNVRFFADVAACHKSHLLLCKLESVMTEAVLIGKPVGDVILHFNLFSFTKKTVFILIIFF